MLSNVVENGAEDKHFHLGGCAPQPGQGLKIIDQNEKVKVKVEMKN